ncbi:MAG TPA: flagellar motor stator protein MotA [Polyangiaceae bacterium]
MSTIVGLVIVLASVLGGFLLSGGPLPVLFQPYELLVIGGAAGGALFISSPGRVFVRVRHAFKKGFGSHAPTKQDYLDLLKLLYQILALIRREGVLALEPHISERQSSSIFQAYPSVLKRHHAMDFLVDGLKQLVDGCSSEELAMLFDAELETHHDEEHQPIGLIRQAGESLPGMGIVAAVLGIIITMAHLDGGPEEIGHHVAAALVGTFLGILLCYGVVGPIANSAEMQSAAEGRYMHCIKEAVVAAARGVNPAIAIEFARRAIFSDERPTGPELEQAFAELKGKPA